MTNDQFFLFPMLSYGYKNTVGVVAHLFFSDPPLRPHANITQLPTAVKPGIYELAFTMGKQFLTANWATVGRILIIYRPL